MNRPTWKRRFVQFSKRNQRNCLYIPQAPLLRSLWNFFSSSVAMIHSRIPLICRLIYMQHTTFKRCSARDVRQTHLCKKSLSLTSMILTLPGVLFSKLMSRQCLRCGLSNRPCSRPSCSRHTLSFSTICCSSDCRFPLSSKPQSRASSRTRLGSEGSGLGRRISGSPGSPGMDSLTPWGVNFCCSLQIKPTKRGSDWKSIKLVNPNWLEDCW